MLKAAIATFSTFLAEHGGDPDHVVKVVCDMSPAFLSGVAKHLPRAEVTVVWFHIVQAFTKALALRPDQRAPGGHDGLFQAARSRARGYRNEANFIVMIYLIGSLVGRMLDHTKST